MGFLTILLAAAIFVIWPVKQMCSGIEAGVRKRSGAAILYAILSLALVLSGFAAFMVTVNLNDTEGLALFPPWFFAAAIAFFVILIWSWLIKRNTTCPRCKEPFVAKKIGDDDLGVSSNAYTKKVNDSCHTYEKHRHMLTYRCTSCGHEWQKNEEVERQLD